MHVSTRPLHSVPGYAFPFTEQTEHIQKRARLQPVGCFFMLTPDAGDSVVTPSLFHALSFFQLDGFAVPAPAQARNLVYFLLDDAEHKFYNFIKENAHEKNSRFT